MIGLQQIIAKRRAAKSVPATAVTTPPVKRDRAHFRPDGIHLSDVGVAFIRRLFDDGVSISEAAKALGISKAGAQQQRNAWLLKT